MGDKVKQFTSVVIWDDTNKTLLTIHNQNSDPGLNVPFKYLPIGFWSFPFCEGTSKVSEVLLANAIRIESDSNTDESSKFIGKIQTPSFYDIVFEISFYLLISPASKTTTHNSANPVFSWNSPSTLLEKYHNNEAFLFPEILHILQHFKFENIQSFSSKPETNFFSDIVWEYSPNFQCIPIWSNTLAPFKTTNLIVTKNSTSAMIVDPGANQQGKPILLQTLQQLRNSGVTDLQIFITHHHNDHWEGLAAIAEESSQAFQRISVVGHPNTLRNVTTSLPKKEVNGGDAIIVGVLSIDVVHTPGHTDGSLSLLHSPTRALIAGDHVVGIGSAVLDPHCGSMKQYVIKTALGIEPTAQHKINL